MHWWERATLTTMGRALYGFILQLENEKRLKEMQPVWKGA